MQSKRTFYTEFSYILGIIILALGTAFMERANFGMSMVVAPAYLIHLKVSQVLPFFSFGMAEYCLQAVLLVAISVFMGRFKLIYLFSFVTAVLYGFTLDGMMAAVALLPFGSVVSRALFFVVGMVLGSIGVALFFHTYIAPEAYELFVKEFAKKFNKSIPKVKTVYDCTSCIISIILSFAFFGLWHFEGVKFGTIICALINGFLIGRVSAFLDKKYEFKDALKCRKYFEAD